MLFSACANDVLLSRSMQQHTLIHVFEIVERRYICGEDELTEFPWHLDSRTDQLMLKSTLIRSRLKEPSTVTVTPESQSRKAGASIPYSRST